MYSTYIFDFDYTLVNSEQGIVMCFEMLLADEGYPAVPRDAICRTIGKSMMESMHIVTGETDQEKLAQLCHLYKIRYSDIHMAANTHLFPATLPMLKRLKGHGANIAIVSTKTRFRINQTIAKDHLEPFIDFVIGVEDVQAVKPAPEGLLAAIARCQTGKNKTLYIGDSLIDAETARNAGVPFAAVTTGTTKADEFISVPHVQIMSTLDELE